METDIFLAGKHIVLKALTEKGLPVSMAKRMIGDDAEDTLKNVELLEAEMKTTVDAKVAERLKEVDFVPGNDQRPATSNNNPWHPDHFNLTEQSAMMQKDPEKAMRLAKEVSVTLKLE